MAKVRRGGKRTSAPVPQPQTTVKAPAAVSAPASAPAPKQTAAAKRAAAVAASIPQQTPAQTMSQTYNNFSTMNDAQKAAAISAAISQPVPVHLANNDFQKFLYNSNLNDKPDVVSDSALDKIPGQSLFRTVNSNYDKQLDIGYSAPEICKQIMGGSVTRVSDSGGSVYGRGIYFADNLSGSTLYGRTRGNLQETAVIRCKLNSNAKVISYAKASSGAQAEIRSGSQLGKVLQKCDSQSRSSIYAMSKGYNVIHSGGSYYNVLNRQAITMSDKIRAK